MKWNRVTIKVKDTDKIGMFERDLIANIKNFLYLSHRPIIGVTEKDNEIFIEYKKEK